MVQLMRVVFCSTVLVGHVHGFNPAAVPMTQRGPEVQPQNAPNRPSAFLPRTGPSLDAPMPASGVALSATAPQVPMGAQVGEEAVPMAAQYYEQPAPAPQYYEEPLPMTAQYAQEQYAEPQYAMAAESTEREAAMPAGSWSLPAGGWSLLTGGLFGAVLGALGARIFRQSSAASQQPRAGLFQNSFHMDSSPAPQGVESQYTISPEMRGALQGPLVAHMQLGRFFGGGKGSAPAPQRGGTQRAAPRQAPAQDTGNPQGLFDFLTNGSEVGYVRGYGTQASNDFVKDYYNKLKTTPSEGVPATAATRAQADAYNQGRGAAGTESGELEIGKEIVEGSGEIVDVKYTPSPFSAFFGK